MNHIKKTAYVCRFRVLLYKMYTFLVEFFIQYTLTLKTDICYNIDMNVKIALSVGKNNKKFIVNVYKK